MIKKRGRTSDSLVLNKRLKIGEFLISNSFFIIIQAHLVAESYYTQIKWKEIRQVSNNTYLGTPIQECHAHRGYKKLLHNMYIDLGKLLVCTSRGRMGSLC